MNGRNDCCNPPGTCFAMGVLGSAFCSGANAWQATDGGTWWLRTSSYSEPNGDYNANCFLGLGVWTTIDQTAANLQFNDGSCACVLRALAPAARRPRPSHHHVLPRQRRRRTSRDAQRRLFSAHLLRLGSRFLGHRYSTGATYVCSTNDFNSALSPPPTRRVAAQWMRGVAPTLRRRRCIHHGADRRHPCSGFHP